MAKQIYLLYACDEWKTLDNRVLLMASTNRQKIVRAVKKEIRNERMSFASKTGKAGVAVFMNDTYPYSDISDAFNSNLKLGFVQIVDDGKLLEN